MLSSGDSFRAGKIEEMVEFDAELARVTGVAEVDDLDTESEEIKLEMILTRGEVQGRRTHLRHFQVNNVKKRKKDFVGQLLSVVFRPEDMRLIEGSKSRRRGYMNNVLSLLDWGYARSLKTYEEALKKRNKLLFKIREGEMTRSVLTYWNKQIVEHGEYLQKKRTEFLQYFSKVEFPVDFSVKYMPSEISWERLKQYQRQEMMAGRTLVGPHKDDLIVNLSDLNSESDHTNVAIYGSRGQQRLAVLWLKVCELEFLQDKTKQAPVLLLDDILSELDKTSRGYVMELIGKDQVIITTTEKRVVEEIENVADQVQVIEFSLE